MAAQIRPVRASEISDKPTAFNEGEFTVKAGDTVIVNAEACLIIATDRESINIRF